MSEEQFNDLMKQLAAGNSEALKEIYQTDIFRVSEHPSSEGSCRGRFFGVFHQTDEIGCNI